MQRIARAVMALLTIMTLGAGTADATTIGWPGAGSSDCVVGGDNPGALMSDLDDGMVPADGTISSVTFRRDPFKSNYVVGPAVSFKLLRASALGYVVAEETDFVTLNQDVTSVRVNWSAQANDRLAIWWPADRLNGCLGKSDDTVTDLNPGSGTDAFTFYNRSNPT